MFDQALFAEKFRKIVEGRFKRYGYFEYDTEGEILRYKVSRLQILAHDLCALVLKLFAIYGRLLLNVCGPTLSTV